MQTDEKPLELRGGWGSAFVPLAVFLFFCVMLFIVLHAFDIAALAGGGVVALLVGALFARRYSDYWDHAMRGIADRTSIAIVLILFVIGLFSELVKVTNVSVGFVWLANEIGIHGAAFTVFTFVTVCIVAVATGSSIGTMFIAYPIFYTAGVAIGAEPTLLAGAIVSGAIFGDNLAPISDTTIISASAQRFRRREGVADIPGVVAQRARYALTAAAIAAVLFLLFGFVGNESGQQAQIAHADAKPLIMLVPVALMLVVSIVTRDIFKAITVGLVTGLVTALATGLIGWSGVFGAKDGAVTGFIATGTTAIIPTVALVIVVFGIVGVLRGAGVLDKTIQALTRSAALRTPRGSEAAIGIGAAVTTLLFGGVTSASIMTFGPVADEIGSRTGLHPYRRANVMDCFAMSLASVVPLLSAYLFIASQLTASQDGAPAINAGQLFTTALYPLVLTVVMVVAVATGWGRRFEGEGGVASRAPVPPVTEPVTAPSPEADEATAERT